MHEPDHVNTVAQEAGERLLDIGSGPSLKHVMSASAKYKSITLSDVVPDNMKMLQKVRLSGKCSLIIWFWKETRFSQHQLLVSKVGYLQSERSQTREICH